MRGQSSEDSFHELVGNERIGPEWFMAPTHVKILEVFPLHERHHSGAAVPPAAGASRPRIRRGRDARGDSRDGFPTIAPSLFMVPMRAKYGVGATHEPECGAPHGKAPARSATDFGSTKQGPRRMIRANHAQKT